ncbi:MAG: zinc-dependent alcohol dehydrogenase [Planctomycetota bacterium]|jgi:L-iditol 2-dehydrogenase
MQVVAITGTRECALVEKPKPVAKDEFAVVKILAAPMCTEYHAYRDGKASDCLGHEAAGEVVEVGRPGTVKVGDRVVVMPQYPCGRCDLCVAGEYIHCQHTVNPLAATGSEAGRATYAQYVVKQDWLLLPVPEGVSTDHAAMACCGLGPTFGAMQLMEVDAFDTILITGMGPVGLGGVVNARYRGARVIAVEGHPWRAAYAKELGAEHVLDPKDEHAADRVRELTGGRGADKALDTSGSAEAKPLLIDATRRKGHVAFVGWGGKVDAGTIIAKGLTLHGAWHWNLRDTPRIMQVIRESTEQLDRLITHTFPMSHVKDAFEVQVTGECGKVILRPWD